MTSLWLAYAVGGIGMLVEEAKPESRRGGLVMLRWGSLRSPPTYKKLNRMSRYQKYL